ncbi:hypothetical protein PUN28_018992 [Cardiocondyla obscurior]|uniref:Uncharacterized protein n=1 Tax=Cardiocondyla obscurior TaxID=286306 RepID=A0AAW2EIT9_9HYME
MLLHIIQLEDCNYSSADLTVTSVGGFCLKKETPRWLNEKRVESHAARKMRPIYGTIAGRKDVSCPCLATAKRDLVRFRRNSTSGPVSFDIRRNVYQVIDYSDVRTSRAH